MSFEASIEHCEADRRICNVGGLDEVIVTREHWVLRWSYNGKRDDSDYYGVSAHDTLRGARIAMANRERAAAAEDRRLQETTSVFEPGGCG